MLQNGCVSALDACCLNAPSVDPGRLACYFGGSKQAKVTTISETCSVGLVSTVKKLVKGDGVKHLVRVFVHLLGENPVQLGVEVGGVVNLRHIHALVSPARNRLRANILDSRQCTSQA